MSTTLPNLVKGKKRQEMPREKRSRTYPQEHGKCLGHRQGQERKQHDLGMESPAPCFALMIVRVPSFYLYHAPALLPLRLDCNSTAGTKMIMPIRPVFCLVGNLDRGEATVKLL